MLPVIRLRAGLSVRTSDDGAGLAVIGPRDQLLLRIRRRTPDIEALLHQLADTGTQWDPEHPMISSLGVLDRAALVDLDLPGLARVSAFRAPGLSLRALDTPVQVSGLHPDAYLRPAGPDLTLDAPFAPAQALLCNAQGRAWLDWLLAGPDRGEPEDPAWDLLGQLLSHCGLLASTPAPADPWLGWEWHDRLFHDINRGTPGWRPRAGNYHQLELGVGLPDARAHHPGPVLDLPAADETVAARFVDVARARRSVREYAPRPPTLAELGMMLDLSWRRQRLFPGPVEHSLRPAPSGGGLAAMEIYLAVAGGQPSPTPGGITAGDYHYQADTHQLRRLRTPSQLAAASPRTSAPVTLLITYRHNRIAAKYQGIAYSLALQNLGVLYQSLWLAATAVGLGGFPIGAVDSPELTARLTGSGAGHPDPSELVIGMFHLGVAGNAPVKNVSGNP